MFNVGPLDRRVEIQSKSSTQDSTYGSNKTSWITSSTVWSNIQDQMPSKNESVVASGKEVAKTLTRVRLRYAAGKDVVTTDRFKYGDRVFNIVGGPAEIGGRMAFLEFMTQEVLP